MEKKDKSYKIELNCVPKPWVASSNLVARSSKFRPSRHMLWKAFLLHLSISSVRGKLIYFLEQKAVVLMLSATVHRFKLIGLNRVVSIACYSYLLCR